VTRHEFLAALHDLLRPKVYLEVGVQHGTSLALAVYSDVAIGIDPQPLITATGNQHIAKMTSDQWFSLVAPEDVLATPTGVLSASIDLAFIDGSHLFEDALSDFINIERYCGPKSVVVFDDVLPYSQAIAERIQPEGDWTGDVWKVWSILQDYREDLQIHAVDTFPTGTLVVFGFDPNAELANELVLNYDKIVSDWSEDDTVPGYVLRRNNALMPEWALDLVKENVCASPSPEEPASSAGPLSIEPGA
jgi:predicted O-methyltransferase YrrM